MLESVYEDSVALELDRQGIQYSRQLPVPVHYSGEIVGDPLRLDFLIENTIVLEIKSVERLHSVHVSQVLTYIKLTSKPLGLLVNFNTTYLRQGIQRIINSPNYHSTPVRPS